MTLRFILFITLLPMLQPAMVLAQDEDVDCMDCHEDETLEKERHGILISLFVDSDLYSQSVHAEEGCVSCHEDIDPDDLPHEDDLQKVDCALCHDDPIEEYKTSLHGISYRRGTYLAPSCATCHRKHAIRESRDPESWTHESNITALCGSCHKQDMTVEELRPLSKRERRNLDAYEDAMHGEAADRLGLTVTPTCTTCHSPHDLSSTRSTVEAANTAEDTRGAGMAGRAEMSDKCLACHGKIESLHSGVFEGRSWGSFSRDGPVCNDCHRTHKGDKAVTGSAFSDISCLTCHGNPDILRGENDSNASLFVEAEALAVSVHGDLSCVSCHTRVNHDRNPVCRDSGPVNCATCHETQVAVYAGSQHGSHSANGDDNAPACAGCHGTHEILSSSDLASPTYAANIPDLCGRCHREGEPAAIEYTGEEHEIVANYAMSIHGRGLIEAGLVVTATCIDCHTPHGERPATDPRSTVSRDNIGDTCAVCHTGIMEIFKGSVHSPLITDTDKTLPVCNDCHLSHEVSRVTEAEFRQDILDQCGNCHEEVTERYYETFHGKVSKLGSQEVARCFNCHGSHNILPVSNPESMLSEVHVVETCRQCHPRAGVRFTGYLTHADYHDGEKYPRLNLAFLSMTILLVSVFIFFGIHTILWFPRALSERKKYGRMNGGH